MITAKKKLTSVLLTLCLTVVMLAGMVIVAPMSANAQILTDRSITLFINGLSAPLPSSTPIEVFTGDRLQMEASIACLDDPAQKIFIYESLVRGKDITRTREWNISTKYLWSSSILEGTKRLPMIINLDETFNAPDAPGLYRYHLYNERSEPNTDLAFIYVNVKARPRPPVPLDYNVKLNAGKGFMYKNSKSKKTVKSKTISVEYNAKYGKLPTAHRKGYYFKGWYTKKTGGTKVTATSIMKSNKNTTLYAQYKPNGKITNCHVVKVKKSPYNKATTIGYKKYGKTVQVIGKVGTKKYSWYKVKYGNKTGYIYSKYVKSNKPGTKTIKIQ